MGLPAVTSPSFQGIFKKGFGTIFTIYIFMQQIMEKTKTRTAEFWKDEHGIFWIRTLDVEEIDAEDIADNLLVTRTITKAEPHLKVLDSRSKWKMTPEAEAIFKKEDTPEKTIARAVLTDSVADKIIQSFLLTLYKPSVPLKFFTDEADAVKWLLSFK